jgi:hypothetical protein
MSLLRSSSSADAICFVVDDGLHISDKAEGATTTDGESVQTDDLHCRARTGDRQALTALFDRYRGRLRQMIRLCLDR